MHKDAQNQLSKTPIAYEKILFDFSFYSFAMGKTISFGIVPVYNLVVMILHWGKDPDKIYRRQDLKLHWRGERKKVELTSDKTEIRLWIYCTQLKGVLTVHHPIRFGDGSQGVLTAHLV